MRIRTLKDKIYPVQWYLSSCHQLGRYQSPEVERSLQSGIADLGWFEHCEAAVEQLDSYLSSSPWWCHCSQKRSPWGDLSSKTKRFKLLNSLKALTVLTSCVILSLSPEVSNLACRSHTSAGPSWDLVGVVCAALQGSGHDRCAGTSECGYHSTGVHQRYSIPKNHTYIFIHIGKKWMA